MKSALLKFQTQPLKDAARALLGDLGYQSDKYIVDAGSEPQDFINLFAQDDTLNKAKALVSEWKSADLIFQLTDEELSRESTLFSNTAVNSGLLKSYVFIAIELSGKDYARSKFSTIARQINRLFPMPVMVLFKHQDQLTIAVINRRANKQDQSKDVLGKVTLISGINLENPHRGHLDILASLALDKLVHPQKKPIIDFDSLHAAWEQIFNTQLLNERFYKDLANWYFWALPQVEFPADLQPEDEKRRATGLIRLLTRLIFCWFLKEKGLIPDKLFHQADLNQILKGFDPESETSSTFYHAILQNLFFATLNQRMGKDSKGQPYRAFATDDGFVKNRATYDVNNLYRYEVLFKDGPDAALALFQDIPFLNGGLFECLDRTEEGTDKKQYIDGFSRNVKKRPHVPDRLFFDSGETADLSEAYGDNKRKSEKVSGLINILNRYKFTIIENTPIDQEIALDPELLGKVFENLLASYNEETKTTARKQTGSFYTPRPIVEYMVDESLKAHFTRVLVEKAGMTEVDAKAGLEILFAYTEKAHAFEANEVACLITAIDEVKILDPACGSGAFPMGVLHKLVYILSKLDPDNERWKLMQLAKLDSTPMRDELAKTFQENNDDYGRKLFLIENCLYGSDIQPVAVQISKLRFFISLICDQKTNRDKAKNHGIRPLPNLETKFVAADSLIGLNKAIERSLFESPLIEQLENEIQKVRHDYFSVQSRREKLTLQKKDKELRDKLTKVLVQSTFTDQATSLMLAKWDPYSPHVAAEFFEPLWMFDRSLGDGFDIVIGNPPYISVEKFARTRQQGIWRSTFKTFSARGDVYCLFYERGFALLRNGGVLGFITSNKFQKAGYGKSLRQLLAAQRIEILVDFCELPVFEAATDPIIVIAKKIAATPDCEFPVLVVKDEAEFTVLSQSVSARASYYKPAQLKLSGWSLEGANGLALVDKLRAKGTPLNDYVDGQLYLGVRTGLNNAFVIDRATRDRLVQEDKDSAKLIKPWVRGRDIKRWAHEFCDLYVIIVRHGFHTELKHYPAIRRHLSQFEPLLKARGQCQSSRSGSSEGQHHWLELDNNPSEDYIAAFETPKIVIADIGKYLKASWAEPEYYIGNTGYFIANADKFTLAVLLGTVTDWYARMTFQGLGDPWVSGRMRFINRNLVTIPIPHASAADKLELTKLAELATKAAKVGDTATIAIIERDIDEIIYRLFDLTDTEISQIESALINTRNTDMAEEEVDDE